MSRLLRLAALCWLCASIGPAYASNVFFLHHSTGRNLLAEGGVRGHMEHPLWDHDYNYIGLTNPQGDLVGVSYDIPGDNTYPDGLHVLWTTNNAARDSILQYDVIAFKSCYPACDIETDAELDQYKSWYLDIVNQLIGYSDKVFILMSPPPRHRLATNSQCASRCRDFANWLGGLAGDNVLFFDLFDHLAGGDNVLRYEYERSHSGTDSHPNSYANAVIGPLFAASMNAAAEVGTGVQSNESWPWGCLKRTYID